MSVLVLSLTEADLRRILREELRSLMSAESSKSDDRRITYAEAAAAAGVSAATIRSWVAAGKLRAYGQGRGVRFSLSEVRAVRPEPATAGASAEDWAEQHLRGRHG